MELVTVDVALLLLLLSLLGMPISLLGVMVSFGLGVAGFVGF